MESNKSEPESQIILRPAVVDDQNRICEIYSQYFGLTEPTTRHWWTIIENQNINYIVAEENGNVIGVATLVTINKVIRSGNRMGLIEDVAVDKHHSGKGIGRMLIEELKELAIKKSCYKVILNCSEDNIGFYEKCGFYQKEVQMRWDRPPKD